MQVLLDRCFQRGMDENVHLLADQNQISVFICSAIAYRYLMVTMDIMCIHVYAGNCTVSISDVSALYD